jgi:hypothetical protein
LHVFIGDAKEILRRIGEHRCYREAHAALMFREDADLADNWRSSAEPDS